MRRNALHERKLIYTAIEGISNTTTARKYGKGATTREIMKYTNFKRVTIDASLKFLVRWGLIKNMGIRLQEWFIKSVPPDGFCWLHGVQRTLGGKCICCINDEGR
jgi:hypothetical protein